MAWLVLGAILPVAVVTPELRIILQLLSAALFSVFVTVAIDLYPAILIS
jgi:hypothetical protein